MIRDLPTVAKNVVKVAGFLTILAYEVVSDTIKGKVGSK